MSIPKGLSDSYHAPNYNMIEIHSFHLPTFVQFSSLVTWIGSGHVRRSDIVLATVTKISLRYQFSHSLASILVVLSVIGHVVVQRRFVIHPHTVPRQVLLRVADANVFLEFLDHSIDCHRFHP